MSSNRRLLVIVGIVVIAGLGFIFAKGSDNNNENFPNDTVSGFTTSTAPAPSTTAPGSSARRPALVHEGVIVVRGLRPVDGVERMTFHKGDTIRFAVSSDQPEEVHFHGYDVAKEVMPGAPASFAVPATIEGVFEVEVEGAGTQIASVTVEP